MDIQAIIQDFPLIAHGKQNGRRLVYLDSAATSQKPQCVIDAESRYYETINANIHRGIYQIAEEATAENENTREKARAFIHADSSSEIIFTRNATESINLVARTWGETFLKEGDLILLTEMEHHANLVPWYMLADKKKLQLANIPVQEDGLLDLDAYAHLLEKKPKLVCVSAMSNVLGTIPPVKEMISAAHDAGALFLVDGAQAVPHFPVNVRDWNCDFLAFSAHKMLGPTGIGVLYGKEALLDAMPPFLGGGEMIAKVHFGSFTCNDLPYKFEAGTPAIAEAIAFSPALDYLGHLGMENVFAHEQELTHYAIDHLKQLPGLKIFGPLEGVRGGTVSFTLDYAHPHDVAQILDAEAVCVRAGHHCAMPLHERFHIPATTRASFYIYNTPDDIDRLIQAIDKVHQMFA